MSESSDSDITGNLPQPSGTEANTRIRMTSTARAYLSFFDGDVARATTCVQGHLEEYRSGIKEQNAADYDRFTRLDEKSLQTLPIPEAYNPDQPINVMR